MRDNTDINQKYVLITSSNFPSGGAGATYLNLFCKGLVFNGHSVKVYLTRGFAFKSHLNKIQRNNKTVDGVSYSYLGLTKRPRLIFLKVFDDFLSYCHLLFLLPSIAWKKERTIVLVYQADFYHGVLLYLTKNLFKIKIITFVPEYFNKANFPGFFNKLKWNAFYLTFKHLNPLSDGLIVFSNFLKDTYTKLGVKEDRIFVQPNLTDFEFWNYSGSDEKYTIGYCGTPGEKDGLNYLFDAINLLKDQIPVSLIVVGDSPFGKSMIPGLEALCEKLGIRAQVYFTGLVDYEQVKSYLSDCKILAITRPKNIQTQAGFPTKLGEYMALKKPVLATDFGDVERYFTDGREIVIAKCNDHESIADKIRWMIQNGKITDAIAVNGFNKAYELLEYKKSVIRIIDFIKRKSE